VSVELIEAQRDGRACVVCGSENDADDLLMPMPTDGNPWLVACAGRCAVRAALHLLDPSAVRLWQERLAERGERRWREWRQRYGLD
jgi:ferredoxin